MRRGWPAYALARIRLLRRYWRLAAEKVAEACRSLYGSRCLAVYVVGGVAEDRITVFSDLDIVVVVDGVGVDRVWDVVRLREAAYEAGVPDDIQLDIKVYTRGELEELLRRGLYPRRIVIYEARG